MERALNVRNQVGCREMIASRRVNRNSQFFLDGGDRRGDQPQQGNQ
jgi:hypothetical protein